MMTTQATTQLTHSIDLAKLRLADWFLIAGSFNQKNEWGYYRWRDTVEPNTLKELKLEEWEAIAQSIGYSEGWAYKQFKAYSVQN